MTTMDKPGIIESYNSMDSSTHRTIAYHAHGNKSSLVNMLLNASLHNDTNETMNSGDPDANALHKPQYLTILVTFFYCLIYVFGITGNAMVILVVWRNKTMRNSTNVFLVNLSVADLCVILICMPLALLEFHSEEIWYLGDIVCRLVIYLENASVHASAVTIMVISFERYYAICCPLKAQYICTLSRTLKIILVVWLATLLWTSPFLWIARTRQEYHIVAKSEVDICSTVVDTAWKKTFIFSCLAVFYALPLLVIMVLYGCIIKCLTGNSDVLNNGKTASGSSGRLRKQVVLMLLSVIIFFFICTLPIKVVAIWMMHVSTETLQKLGLVAYLNIMNFSRVMFYLNSACNPILYNVFSTKFRSAFKKLCSCCFCHSGNKEEMIRLDSNGHYHYKRSYKTHIPECTSLTKVDL